MTVIRVDLHGCLHSVLDTWNGRQIQWTDREWARSFGIGGWMEFNSEIRVLRLGFLEREFKVSGRLLVVPIPLDDSSDNWKILTGRNGIRASTWSIVDGVEVKISGFRSDEIKMGKGSGSKKRNEFHG